MLEEAKKGSRPLTFTSIISSDPQASMRKARQMELPAGPRPHTLKRFGMVQLLERSYGAHTCQPGLGQHTPIKSICVSAGKLNVINKDHQRLHIGSSSTLPPIESPKTFGVQEGLAFRNCR